MFAKSIRLRFQLWLAFLLLIVLSGFGFTAFHLNRGAQLKQIDAQLVRRLGALGVDVRTPPPGRGRGFGGPRDRNVPPDERPGEPGMPPPGEERFRKGPPTDRDFRGPPSFMMNREIHLSTRTENLFDETETNGFFYIVWSRAGNVLKQSTNAPANFAQPPRPGRDITVQFQNTHKTRHAYQFTEFGDCILVGRSIADHWAGNRRFALWLFAAGVGVLFVALAGGWILTTRALRPIRDISRAATQISGGDLSQRINAADTDSELGQLANLLNTTFNRLDAAFAQQKQFTADAAHELRTPLAVIISETQTALNRPRTAEEYRETVEACLETAQRMRALTSSLLELARFDAGQEKIRKEPFDLAETTRRCIAEAEKIAAAKNIQIESNLQPAPTTGDSERIAQVITNLLTNAVHYSKENGKIEIQTRAENNRAVLTIKDTGVGISPEALPHVFERFYRADASRTGGSGHSGLGLAISKAIIDAHHGTISVESSLGEGTTFRVIV
ncbi:MAG TPA: ATP-binding protein [Verrucomicrobiae bacterium]|nr:ATP-binding protein [Verrucomicrobiae bacterium]